MSIENTLAEFEKLVDIGVSSSGQDYFDTITQKVATTFAADIVFIGELIYPDKSEIKTVSRCIGTEIVDNSTYLLKNTPCEEVVGKTACCYPDNVLEQYPHESFLQEMGIVGYLGVPLFSINGEALGHIVALYREPIRNDTTMRIVMQLFAGRLGQELERLKLSERLEESEKARTNAEFMLYHAEKMTAIGELAGGVAHDFNNQLTSIKGYAELLTTMINPVDKTHQYAANILKSAERSADITKQLLSFSRKKPPQTSQCDIHDIVCEVHELMLRSIPKNIHLKLSLEANNSLVEVDQSLCQSALMNLVINAKDACLDHGEIVISSESIELTKKHLQQLGIKLAEGRYIKLGVSDNGTGIEPEVMVKIFEPYFTTKDLGKGSGIGLTAVYNTFLNHGGYVWVESSPGLGAKFFCLLPLVNEANPDNSNTHPVKPASDETQLNVLVVDDEPMVLEVSSLMLESLGHNVSSYTEPNEALEHYREQYQNIDVIIIDMIMPTMTGKELFSQLRKVNPDAMVIIASGYQMNENSEQLLQMGLKGFLSKPFSIETLTAKLAETISS